MNITDLYRQLFGRKGPVNGNVIDMAEHGRVGGLSTGDGYKRVGLQETEPTDSTNNNPSYSLSYTSDELTQIDMTIGTTTYRRTLEWTSNNLTAMSSWSEV